MTWLEKHLTMIARSPEGGGSGGAGESGSGGGGPSGGGAGAGGTAASAGAGAAKPWFDGIDSTIIGHWDNKGWKKDDPKALATELTNAWKGLERHFGVSADQLIKLPKDTADAAAMAEVYQRLGAPREAKDYDFSAVKRADGTPPDAALVDKLRAALHGAGVAKDRATEILKTVVAHDDAQAKSAADARAAKLTTERAALQQEWGTNWEFNRLTAMQGARRLGISEAEVAQMEGVIGYRRTMEFFQRIGASTSEDTFVSGSARGGNPTTRAGAQARLAELTADPDWGKRLTSGDAKAKQELANLMIQLHGEAA